MVTPRYAGILTYIIINKKSLNQRKHVLDNKIKNTLLDSIYTNISININSCKSGILTSSISNHFFVFGTIDNLKLNNDRNTYKIRNLSKSGTPKFWRI